MSEENTTQPSELDELKARADQLGITYHPNIGVDKLREKVNAELQSKEPANDDTSEDSGEPVGSGDEQTETVNERRIRQKKEASKLARVRVTCMNPNKREYDGEFFCTGNRVVGTHKKFVRFDTEWHVPQIILNMIKQKKCQVFTTERDSRGRSVKRGKQIKEYSVEVLPSLTKKELQELAQRQAMANGTAAA